VSGGSPDTSRLDDRQLYRFVAAGRIDDVVYDRKADAQVPAQAETGEESEARQRD